MAFSISPPHTEFNGAHYHKKKMAAQFVHNICEGFFFVLFLWTDSMKTVTAAIIFKSQHWQELLGS